MRKKLREQKRQKFVGSEFSLTKKRVGFLRSETYRPKPSASKPKPINTRIAIIIK